MGGCVGCSSAALLAIAQPARVRSMVLFSPAGGVTYRTAQHNRFARHLSFVLENGVEAVVELARSTTAGFTKDPRVGPWAAVLRSDDAFASACSASRSCPARRAFCSTGTRCPGQNRKIFSCSRLRLLSCQVKTSRTLVRLRGTWRSVSPRQNSGMCRWPSRQRRRRRHVCVSSWHNTEAKRVSPVATPGA
jgi:hypothetical protein